MMASFMSTIDACHQVLNGGIYITLCSYSDGVDGEEEKVKEDQSKYKS